MNFAIHSPLFLGISYINVQTHKNMYSMMIYLISSALQQHAPIEKTFVRNLKPKNVLKTERFDSECQQLLIKKQNSLRSCRTQSTSNSWSKYQFLHNQMSQLIRSKNSITQKIVFHFSALSNKNGNILTKLEVHVLATIELQFYEIPSLK